MIEFENTFTVISDVDNGLEWPDGFRTITSLMEGPLADRIRKAVGVHERTPVVIIEERTDGGYSEYTQETDYDFELRVGNERIQLQGYHYNSVAALSAWLKEAED